MMTLEEQLKWIEYGLDNNPPGYSPHWDAIRSLLEDWKQLRETNSKLNHRIQATEEEAKKLLSELRAAADAAADAMALVLSHEGHIDKLEELETTQRELFNYMKINKDKKCQ